MSIARWFVLTLTMFFITNCASTSRAIGVDGNLYDPSGLSADFKYVKGFPLIPLRGDMHSEQMSQLILKVFETQFKDGKPLPRTGDGYWVLVHSLCEFGLVIKHIEYLITDKLDTCSSCKSHYITEVHPTTWTDAIGNRWSIACGEKADYPTIPDYFLNVHDTCTDQINEKESTAWLIYPNRASRAVCVICHARPKN
jgi:hypothetical protein